MVRIGNVLFRSRKSVKVTRRLHTRKVRRMNVQAFVWSLLTAALPLFVGVLEIARELIDLYRFKASLRNVQID